MWWNFLFKSSTIYEIQWRQPEFEDNYPTMGTPDSTYAAQMPQGGDGHAWNQTDWNIRVRGFWGFTLFTVLWTSIVSCYHIIEFNRKHYQTLEEKALVENMTFKNWNVVANGLFSQRAVWEKLPNRLVIILVLLFVTIMTLLIVNQSEWWLRSRTQGMWHLEGFAQSLVSDPLPSRKPTRTLTQAPCSNLLMRISLSQDKNARMWEYASERSGLTLELHKK